MVQEISSSVRQSNGHSVINMCSKNKPAIAIRLLKTTSACITNNRGRGGGGGVCLAKTEKTGCGTMRIQKERKERKTRSKENQSTVAWTRRCCRI
jgi:hypothetical protein